LAALSVSLSSSMWVSSSVGDYDAVDLARQVGIVDERPDRLRKLGVLPSPDGGDEPQEPLKPRSPPELDHGRQSRNVSPGAIFRL
jgi:hypothetical protein